MHNSLTVVRTLNTLIASSPTSLLLTQLTVCHSREINKYVTIYRALRSQSLHAMDYVAIAKGRGYVYGHDNQLTVPLGKKETIRDVLKVLHRPMCIQLIVEYYE